MAQLEITPHASRLTRWPSRFGAVLTAKLLQASDRLFQPLPLQADRYDRKFLFAVGSVLAFTLLAYWTLTDFWNVQWFAGEDGLSEWWSVAAYVVSAAMAGFTARWLMRLGHRGLGMFNVLLAAAFLFGALEEISWGQRLFEWSTPEALSRINEQDETSIHNLPSFDSVFTTLIFWASIVALLGAVARAVLHRHQRVTTADFILPSLVLSPALSPALLMIMFWIVGGQSFPGNIPRLVLTHFDLDPVGSEIPEVLVGLGLCVYTYSNFRRAATLKSH